VAVFAFSLRISTMSGLENPGRYHTAVFAAVLNEDELFSLIATWLSQGSLQLLSMTSRFWLDRAYKLAAEAWSVVDMAAWPFAARERELERRQMWFSRRIKEMEQRWKQRQEAGLPIFSAEDNIHADSRHEYILRITEEELTRPRSLSVSGGRHKSELRDASFRDDELASALRRIPCGKIQRLSTCSSLLTTTGFCQSLQLHATRLLELCVSDCQSGNLRGVDLQAALDRCVSLRALELYGVQAFPPTAAHGLQELILGNRVSLPPAGMARQFPDLRVMRLSGAWPEELLLEFFGTCSELRDIHIMNCECVVSHKMLACLMTHTPRLEHFCGYRDGLGGMIGMQGATVMFPFAEGEEHVPAAGLSIMAVDAFKQRFPAADIYVDWPEMDNLTGALQELMEE